jgi:regulator of sigma D
MKLKNIYVDVPCGWNYKVPETHFRVESNSFHNLCDEVIEHLRINKFDIPDDICDKIEADIAKRVPEFMRG